MIPRTLPAATIKGLSSSTMSAWGMVDMLRVTVIVFLSSPYILTTATPWEQDGKTTCNVPAVEPMGKTFLTCHFPEDVNRTRKDFSVNLYHQSGNSAAMLDCWWLRGKLNCYVHPQYSFNNMISHKLVLEIPQVSLQHLGTYACQFANIPIEKITTCNLNFVIEGRTVCEMQSVKKDSGTSLSCYFPEDLSKSRADFAVYHHSSDGVTDQVLSCQWEEASLNCATIRGYQFDKSVTDNLTLTIPRASRDHEGNYSCHIIDAKSVRFENCSFMLEKEKTSSCNMSSVEEMEPTTLTCIFSIDLNETRTNFRVFRLSDQKKEGAEILNCAWADNKLLCTTAPGYEFSNSVTNRVVIRIPTATREHNGTYTCHLQRSEFENADSCEFFLKTRGFVSAISSAFIAVTVAAVIVMCIPVTLIIVFFVCRNRQGTTSEKAVSDEEKPMIQKTTQIDRITNDLLNFLKEEFRKMYPDYNTKSYFVPSLYLNTNKYRTVNVAGEHVYVTEPPEEKVVKYDMAMHRVLNSLRLVAKHEKGMFVISQFSYDNYMTYVSEASANHKLLMPAALREQDGHYGNFDVLIVHRRLGVLVGVVKAFSDDLPLEAAEEKELILVDELKKAYTELDNAERMLKHLVSDSMRNLCVHKTLFLPNLHQDRLNKILDVHKDVVETLIACHGDSEISAVPKECLCSELLADTTEPSHLTDWLYRRRPQSRGEARANDEQYVAILARFCGPATKWSLQIPGSHQTDVLPTTLSDSVNMTGDLFNSPIFQREQLAVLNADDPLVFLTGPPASGKTRTLVLAGRRWLAAGHDVHVVSTWTGSQAASVMMCRELSRESGDIRASKASGRVFLDEFNLEDKGVDKTIKEMSRMAVEGSLHIIADEAIHCNRTEKSKFKAFVEGLQKQVSRLHLWASTCFPYVAPECCHVHVFTNTFTCPPTILLHPEVNKIARECDITTHNHDSRRTAPTEGPSLKFVHHGDRGHLKSQTFECRKCAEEVAAFLRTLHMCPKDTCKSPMTMACVSEHLHYDDVLILFETKFSGESAFCKELRKQGMTINILEKEDRKAVENVLKFTGNEVLVTKGKHLLGMKRKIVIYVEEDPKNSKEMPVRWKRLRGLTSSTSQLIWVKRRK